MGRAVGGAEGARWAILSFTAGDTPVVDAYRYWTREAIVADIDARRHPFHVAIENFAHDANIGTVVRTANAFGRPPRCTSSGGGAGTGAGRWSPTATSI